MYCKYCGNNLDNDAKFCSSCGARVEEAEQPAAEEIASYVYDDVMPDPYEEALERGEHLQVYVEELLPPQEYPGYIIYCAFYADTQILSIDWEEDLEVYLHLSPEYEEGQSEDCPEEEE